MIPPGPRLPLALQTLGWIARPGPFMERCRDRYGDAFSLSWALERLARHPHAWARHERHSADHRPPPM